MHLKVYGIKNCDTVKKTLKFLDSHDFEYEFLDFKEQKPSVEKIRRWTNAVGVKKLFNTRSTTYRNLGLKQLQLNDEQKIEYMAKEPLLIKRAVVESDTNVVVGYDEAALHNLIGG